MVIKSLKIGPVCYTAEANGYKNELIISYEQRKPKAEKEPKEGWGLQTSTVNGLRKNCPVFF